MCLAHPNVAKRMERTPAPRLSRGRNSAFWNIEPALAQVIGVQVPACTIGKRVPSECVQLAAAFESCCVSDRLACYESGSKLHALHTLRAIRTRYAEHDWLET